MAGPSGPTAAAPPAASLRKRFATLKPARRLRSACPLGRRATTSEERGRCCASVGDITTTGASGNVVGNVIIPQLFDNVLNDAKKLAGNTVSVVRHKVTNNNGAPIKIGTANDTGNTLTTLTPKRTAVTRAGPGSWRIYWCRPIPQPRWSRFLLQDLEDSAFDLDAWIKAKFGLRYYRGLEYMITNGNTSNAVSMVTGATLGGTMLANTGPVYDDRAAATVRWNLQHPQRQAGDESADPRRGHGTKDTLGRPIFIPNPNTGTLDYILGLPIVLEPGAFGCNHSRSYWHPARRLERATSCARTGCCRFAGWKSGTSTRWRSASWLTPALAATTSTPAPIPSCGSPPTPKQAVTRCAGGQQPPACPFHLERIHARCAQPRVSTVPHAHAGDCRRTCRGRRRTRSNLDYNGCAEQVKTADLGLVPVSGPADATFARQQNGHHR